MVAGFHLGLEVPSALSGALVLAIAIIDVLPGLDEVVASKRA
jgi:hypothetical protein